MDKYNKRIFLNGINSHYTGSLVCHDGIVSNRGKPPARYTFIEVSDCHGKVRIHTDDNLQLEDYINKLKLLQTEINNFITHLESTK